jgi:hypothetical protein
MAAEGTGDQGLGQGARLFYGGVGQDWQPVRVGPYWSSWAGFHPVAPTVLGFFDGKKFQTLSASDPPDAGSTTLATLNFYPSQWVEDGQHIVACEGGYAPNASEFRCAQSTDAGRRFEETQPWKPPIEHALKVDKPTGAVFALEAAKPPEFKRTLWRLEGARWSKKAIAPQGCDWVRGGLGAAWLACPSHASGDKKREGWCGTTYVRPVDNGNSWAYASAVEDDPTRFAVTFSAADGSSNGLWATCGSKLAHSREGLGWDVTWPVGPADGYAFVTNSKGEVSLLSKDASDPRVTWSRLDGQGNWRIARLPIPQLTAVAALDNASTPGSVLGVDSHGDVSRIAFDPSVTVQKLEVRPVAEGARAATDGTGRFAATGVHCNDVSDPAPRNCWVLGSDGQIYESKDRGNSWKAVLSASPGSASFRRMVSIDRAWKSSGTAAAAPTCLLAFGDNGRMAESFDGGQRWEEQPYGSGNINAVFGNGNIYAASATSRGRIFVGGQGGVVIGGTTYGTVGEGKGISFSLNFRFLPQNSKDVLAITEADDGTLYMATAGRSIYRSLDNGDSWTEIYSSESKVDATSAVFEHEDSGGLAAWFTNGSANRVVDDALTERVKLSPGERLPEATSVSLKEEGVSAVRVNVVFDKAPEKDSVVAVYVGDGFRSELRRVLGPPTTFEATLDRKEFGLADGQEVGVAVELDANRYRRRFVTKAPFILRRFAFLREHWKASATVATFAVIALGLLSLFLAAPLMLGDLYARWPKRGSLKSLPSWISGPAVVLGELTLLPFLARRHRVLDAWTKRAKVRFAPPVAAGYVPLPVKVGEGVVHFAESGNATFLFESKDLGADQRRSVLIEGPGGAGKTMLLRRLIGWVHDGILGHPAIVILVDSDADPVLSAKGGVLEGVSTRLAPPETPEEPQNEAFVRALLRAGRVVLAFDHVSELNESSRDRILGLREHLAVRHLLLTSRTKLAPFGSDVLSLEPSLLGAADVARFIAQLFSLCGLSDVERMGETTRQAAAFLRAELSDEARVPALVVWLFVDALEKRQFLTSAMPASIAALYFAYVNWHAERVAEERSAEVLAGMRTLASRCVQKSGEVASLNEVDAKKILRRAGADDDEDLAKRLTVSGLLERRRVGTVWFIRYALDPVAEYLAMEDLALQTLADPEGRETRLKRVTADLDATPALADVFRRVVALLGPDYGIQTQVAPAKENAQPMATAPLPEPASE